MEVLVQMLTQMLVTSWIVNRTMHKANMRRLTHPGNLVGHLKTAIQLSSDLCSLLVQVVQLLGWGERGRDGEREESRLQRANKDPGGT